MIEQITRYKLYGPELRELTANPGAGPEETELTSRSVYLDLEHYIYHKPIALGIFGAAVRENDELICTQYFLENKTDLKTMVLRSHEYLMRKRREGYDHLVAFAARNDLMVLHAMFHKFGLNTNLREVFQVVDLQTRFHKDFSAMIGLNALEQFAGVERTGPSISGSTIAKTFAAVMADPNYILRMPTEKKSRLLEYNRMDVVNLYYILDAWPDISQVEVDRFLGERKAAQQQRQMAREVVEDQSHYES